LVEEFGIDIRSHTVAIGGKWIKGDQPIDWQRVEESKVRCADAEAERAMIAAIDEAISDGDTVGGVFEVVAAGVPIGLGSHVHWDRRLDGQIARAILSINSVKGAEVGAGFALADLKGSQAHDIIEPADKAPPPWQRTSNRAGGVEGGISNGEPIVVRGAVKPIPTLATPLKSVDIRTRDAVQAHFERADICIVPAAGVIGEAMLAIVLADAILEKFGGDNLKETLNNYHSYLRSIAPKGA